MLILILANINLILFFIIAFKYSLSWMYLWQRKEYRLDKMLDYIKMPESRNFILDKWSKLRAGYVFFILLVLLFFYFLKPCEKPGFSCYSFNFKNVELVNEFDKVKLMIYTFLAINLFSFIQNLIESLIFSYKLFSNKQKIPTFTSKAKLIYAFSLVSILAIVAVNYLYVNDHFIVDDILIINLFILFTPFIVAIWIVVFFPLDQIVKQKLLTAAKKHRLAYLNNTKIIAISGSYGKTTTKELVGQFLQSKYKIDKTYKNQNADISCARAVLKLQSNLDYYVCELGAYQKGDGARICNFLKPNMAVITGLNYQHFGLFGSEKNIIEAESEAVNFLSSGEFVVINWNSQLCRQIQVPSTLKLIKCGIEEKETELELDVFAVNPKFDLQNTSFEIGFSQNFKNLCNKELPSSLVVSTNLISRGNLENLLLSIAVSLLQNVEFKQIIIKLNTLVAPLGRLEIKPTTSAKIIYNEYNNFDGISNSLELSSGQSTAVLIDDISELGDKSVSTHLEIADILLKSKPKIVVLLGRSFGSLVKEKLEKNNFAGEIIVWNEKNTVEIKNTIRLKIKKSQEEWLIFCLGYQSKNFLDI